MSPSEWVPIACTLIAAFGGLIGGMIRHHLTVAAEDRDSYRKLQEKVMDQAIPALEHNAAATDAMVDVTRTLSERLLIMQDRENRKR